MRICNIVGAILGLSLSSLAGANCPQTVTHDTLAPKGSTAETFTVPFTLIDNRIFVHVCLNDQGPFNVIFDTGADAVVTPQTAQALRLKPVDGGEVTGVGANKSSPA